MPPKLRILPVRTYGPYGYPQVTRLLQGESWHVSHKRVARVWSEERQCSMIRMTRRICPYDVLEQLTDLCILYGVPEVIRTSNGAGSFADIGRTHGASSVHHPNTAWFWTHEGRQVPHHRKRTHALDQQTGACQGM